MKARTVVRGGHYVTLDLSSGKERAGEAGKDSMGGHHRLGGVFSIALVYRNSLCKLPIDGCRYWPWENVIASIDGYCRQQETRNCVQQFPSPPQ